MWLFEAAGRRRILCGEPESETSYMCLLEAAGRRRICCGEALSETMSESAAAMAPADGLPHQRPDAYHVCVSTDVICTWNTRHDTPTALLHAALGNNYIGCCCHVEIDAWQNLYVCEACMDGA